MRASARPPSPDPPAATLTLYLNASCRAQNAQLTAVEGTVVFERLFSGDPNEEDSDDRLTRGSFEATVVDPTPLSEEGDLARLDSDKG